MGDEEEEIEYWKDWLRLSLYKEIESHEKSLSPEEIIDVLKGLVNSYIKKG